MERQLGLLYVNVKVSRGTLVRQAGSGKREAGSGKREAVSVTAVSKNGGKPRLNAHLTPSSLSDFVSIRIYLDLSTYPF
jgi:hypothetical protein